MNADINKHDTHSSLRLRQFKAPYQHHVPIDDLTRCFAKMRMDTPPIKNVPQEVLLHIVEYLHVLKQHEVIVRHSRRDILNLCQTSRQLRAAATTVLYRSVRLSSARSVGRLLSTLSQNPGLARLVRELRGPPLSDPPSLLAYVFLDAEDTSHNGIISNHQTSRYPGLKLLLAGVLFVGPIRDGVGNQLLKGILRLLPQLRSLVIPQAQIFGGPYTGQVRLEHLTDLCVSVPHHPETSFERCPGSYSRRLLSWMEPRGLSARFPALKRLAIRTPTGQWTAEFDGVYGGLRGDGTPGKYVSTLNIYRTNCDGPAEVSYPTIREQLSSPFGCFFKFSKHALPGTIKAEYPWNISCKTYLLLPSANTNSHPRSGTS